MITLISVVIIAGIILFAMKFGFTGINQLTKTDKIHLITISIINLSLIFKLIISAWNGNDKGIILVFFGYIALIIINVIIWETLRILKRPESKIYKIVTAGLALLFIPTIIISSLY